MSKHKLIDAYTSKSLDAAFKALDVQRNHQTQTKVEHMITFNPNDPIEINKQKIQSVMEMYGKSQRELSDAIGYSSSYIKQVLSERIDFTVNTANRLNTLVQQNGKKLTKKQISAMKQTRRPQARHMKKKIKATKIGIKEFGTVDQPATNEPILFEADQRILSEPEFIERVNEIKNVLFKTAIEKALTNLERDLGIK